MKTDLPGPKLNRRKRPVMGFAALVVAVSALGAAYWLARPPELVWWRSPSIDGKGPRIRVLIPHGWESFPPVKSGDALTYTIQPADRRPRILRWLVRTPNEAGVIQLNVIKHRLQRYGPVFGVNRQDTPGSHYGVHELALSDGGLWVQVVYYRANLPVFNRTYRQICNSLKIE